MLAARSGRAQADARATVRGLGPHFGIAGGLLEVRRLAGGHIHDSYVAAYRRDGRRVRYVHQRLNQAVFSDPRRLLDNVARVTEHLHARLAREGVQDPARRALTLVPAQDGFPGWVDVGGAFWRTYLYIEGSRSHAIASSARLAERAAEAFGRFVQMLADLPGPRLHETIPRFHDTPARLQQLRAAAAADPLGRVAEVAAELDFAFARERLAATLEDLRAGGELPTRIVHNDTKINNVLFDARTHEALCVIDLDTVMPGLVLHDFGDLARSSLSAAPEDETQRERIGVRSRVFEALVRGYVRGAAGLLSKRELALLPLATRIMAFEVGMRFLADYLLGDTYFRASWPRHNLERARNQFELVRRLEASEPQLLDAIECMRLGG